MRAKTNNQDSNPRKKRQYFDASLTLCHFHTIDIKPYHRQYDGLFQT